MKVYKNKKGQVLYIPINKDMQLQIKADWPVMEIFRADLISVFLKTKTFKIKLVKDMFFWVFEQQLLVGLQECLEKKRELPVSINQDIGRLNNFVYHGTIHQKNKLEYANNTGGTRYWVGSKYEVWSCYYNPSLHAYTWLYNDTNNTTLLSITPSYNFGSLQPFFQVLKKYKPFYQVHLSDDELKNLILKISDLVGRVNENTEKNRNQILK